MKKIIFLFVLVCFGQCVIAQIGTPKTAAEILKNAILLAKKEKKNVFLKFTASWCGWCHKMDNAMQDTCTLDLFKNNYIITYLDVLETPKQKNLENPGGKEALEKYGGATAGLPYWLIIDKNGKLIANSKVKAETEPLTADGSNSGCPAEDDEINYFLRVLKSSSKLTQSELLIIKKRFENIKGGM
jgi:thiol-disulfide isomerase/thioredoxin